MDRLIRVFVICVIAGGLGLLVSTALQRTGAQAADREAAAQTEDSGAESRFKELKKELDELDAKADSLAAKARTDIARQKKQFKKDHQAAVKKLDALKADASRKWEEVKPELEAAVADVKRAFEKLRSKSEGDPKDSI